MMQTLQCSFITRDPYNLLQFAGLQNFKIFLVISPQEKELKNFKAKRLYFYYVKWIQPNTATQWNPQTSLNEPLQQIISS